MGHIRNMARFVSLVLDWNYNERQKCGDTVRAVKFDFLRFGNILRPPPPPPPPFPLKTMLSFLFLRLHRPQRLHNIELGACVSPEI